jgi:hypothetical protein
MQNEHVIDHHEPHLDKGQVCPKYARTHAVDLQYGDVDKQRQKLGNDAQRSPFDFFGFCWAILAGFVREQGSVVRVVGMGSVAS